MKNETCRQPDICSVKFEAIDEKFESGSNRMTRIEGKADKILFRTNTMLLSFLVFVIGLIFTLSTIYQSHYKPINELMQKIAKSTEEKNIANPGSIASILNQIEHKKGEIE